MNKKQIKINFMFFGEGFNPEDNFFTNLLRKQYNVKISDNPDYLFYSVYPELKKTRNLSKKGDFIKNISPRVYVFLRQVYSKFILFLEGKNSRPTPPPGKYIKIFQGSEHVKPRMDECDWAFSSYFEGDINHPHYMRLPAYVFNDFYLGKKIIPPKIRKTNFNKIKKEKNKFCNFIYSQEVISRNDFFKKLSKYKKIDSPGRCMNNMSPIGNHNSSKKSRMFENWIEEKLDFIKNYKFTIAFENASIPGWSTEKLTHPMLVNSIPIYFGHKDISKEFNPKSFININDFKNIDEMIKHIIRVDNDDKLYKKYLKEPFYTKDNNVNYFDEKRYLNQFKKIFG
ncbi:hypothetical protein ISS08_01320 [Candidatus Pacearchaeota archaeon]|nr:hypothetical protein [Candidatus Pacearchaeota archaeon]